ncbi:MAG: glycosyltransferase [Brevinematia bacterium]
MITLPIISVCLPTYNNAKTIGKCLETIFDQNYPPERLEVIVIDGGSTDETLLIVEKYNVKFLSNPYRIEEKGRVIGINNSRGDIIAFIDADNFLKDCDFFSKMVEPLVENDKVAISQPKYYYFDDKDDIFTQQLGLLSGDDIVAISLGMYERFNYLSLRWTDSRFLSIEKNQRYEVVKFLDLNEMPPIGSNGCFVKKDVLFKVKYDPFIHTDVCYRILNIGYLFSVVETGLVHKQDGSLVTYIRKKNRRLNRNYEDLGREYYQRIHKGKLLLFIVKCILFVPLMVEAILGFIRKPAKFWFFYPFLTEISFLNVVVQVVKRFFKGEKIWK